MTTSSDELDFVVSNYDRLSCDYLTMATNVPVPPKCQDIPKIPIVTADNLCVDGCLIAGCPGVSSEICGFFKSSLLTSEDVCERCNETQPPVSTCLAASSGMCGGLLELGGLPNQRRRSDLAVGLLPQGRPVVLPVRARIQADQASPGHRRIQASPARWNSRGPALIPDDFDILDRAIGFASGRS